MIVAVIPTYYRPETLQPLLDTLAEDGVEVILMDTVGREPDIYRWWNEGCDQAREMGATEIAVLNDDIIIAPCTLPAMARALRADDEIAVVSPALGLNPHVKTDAYARPSIGHWFSTFKYPAFVGWAFMFKAELPLPRFDEKYRWHVGDLAFEEDVRRAGYKTAGIVGIEVDHLGSWSGKQQHDKLWPLIQQDRHLWVRRPFITDRRGKIVKNRETILR